MNRKQCAKTQINNGVAGYLDPVKIELRKGAGLLITNASLNRLYQSNSRNGIQFMYTAISINVVGSKYKAIRQDLKIRWIFFMNKFIKISYASSVQ